MLCVKMFRIYDFAQGWPGAKGWLGIVVFSYFRGYIYSKRTFHGKRGYDCGTSYLEVKSQNVTLLKSHIIVNFI